MKLRRGMILQRVVETVKLMKLKSRKVMKVGKAAELDQ